MTPSHNVLYFGTPVHHERTISRFS